MQALFARKRLRQFDKDRHVRRLLRCRDFLAIVDTHGLEGGTAAWQCPSDCEARFSLGTTSRAGVGVIVKRDFLRQFNTTPPVWQHTMPGRSAVLRLWGRTGALHLHVVLRLWIGQKERMRMFYSNAAA